MRFLPKQWGMFLSLIVAACAPAIAPPRLLVLWHALEPERGIALARLTEAYMAEHPDTAIYIETFPGPQELLKRLQQPLERGPDVVLIPAEAARELEAAGRLTSLQRWLEDPRNGLTPDERQDFLAPFAPTAVPFSRDGLIIYADGDRLLESGFERPPADWAGIRQVCIRGALDLDGDGRPDTAGWIAPQMGQVLQGWLMGRSEEEAMALLRDVQFMLRVGCARLSDPSTALRDFIGGETVMLFGPVRWLPILEREAEAGRLRFRLVLAPLPNPAQGGRPVIPGWGWDLAITAQDPSQQAAAWSFLRWAVGIEAQTRWAQEARTLPVRRSAVLRLRQEARSQAMQEMLWGWILEGYMEEPPVGPDGERRLEAALDQLASGADPREILRGLQNP